MALIYRSYGCDSSGESEEMHVFELLQDSNDGPPNFCPKCGHPVDPETETVPGTHSIGGSNIAKGVDLTYQLLEQSSAEHAEITGNPNHKITNMKDHLREGDVAVQMPRNSITQFMDVAADKGLHYGFGGGNMLQTSNPTPIPRTGYTGPGHVALSAVQGDSAGSTHLASKSTMMRAGQINKTGR